RRAELLDRAPLGAAAARTRAVPALSPAARARRGTVPPARRQEHRDRPLRRRGAPVRAGDRRYPAHAAAPLPAGERIRGHRLGRGVPGPRLDLRRLLRRGRRGRGPAGPGAAGTAGGARRGLGARALQLALVRAPRRRAAGARTALVALAPAPGALRARVDG